MYQHTHTPSYPWSVMNILVLHLKQWLKGKVVTTFASFHLTTRWQPDRGAIVRQAHTQTSGVFNETEADTVSRWNRRPPPGNFRFSASKMLPHLAKSELFHGLLDELWSVEKSWQHTRSYTLEDNTVIMNALLQTDKDIFLGSDSRR